jgi:RimJ/RimL family protein N-acetyltransferase
MAKPILETPRLSLREMTRDDLGFVAELLADAREMRYYPKCYSREEAAAWIDRSLRGYAEYGHAFWLVSLRATGEPMGQASLVRHEIDGQTEVGLGYLIHPPFWQHGYASEAASAIRDYAFDKLEKDRIVCMVRPVNIASQRVALRIGLKPERLTMFKDFEHLMFSQNRPVAHSLQA